MSYYERWLHRLAKRSGEVRLGDAGRAAKRTTGAGLAQGDSCAYRWQTVPGTLNRGIASSQDASVRPLFKVGERVRARNIHPSGPHPPAALCARQGGRRSFVTMVSITSPTPTRIFRARSGSTSTLSASQRASCGARQPRSAIPSTSTCGMTTLSEPDVTADFRPPVPVTSSAPR